MLFMTRNGRKQPLRAMASAGPLTKPLVGQNGTVRCSAGRGRAQEGDLVRLRTAKQALCALLKSFKVPMSPDRNCVTSYTRNLDEFDAKGNRPNAETLTLFRQAVADMNAEWQNRAAPRAAGRP